MNEIISKIKNCRTMQDLDRMASEVVMFGMENGQEKFVAVQQAFRSKKDSIKRNKALNWEEKQTNFDIRMGKKWNSKRFASKVLR